MNKNAQVLIVTGGWDGKQFLSSTEVSSQNHLMKMSFVRKIVQRSRVFQFNNQVAIYSGAGSQLEWREVETGQLPTPRAGLKAAVVDNYFYVTGGDDHNKLTEILRFDPSTNSWQQVGNLAQERHDHSAVAIPSSIIESECS